MEMSERRVKIMEFLELGRSTTMKVLAAMFDVTVRTIRSDIADLTAKYPLKTVRGRNGGVKLADRYHLRRGTMSHRHQVMLLNHILEVNEPLKKDLTEILSTYGSLAFINQIPGKHS